MTDLIKVFFRGLLAVCGTLAVVAIVWAAYIKRDALASALAPEAGLVDSLRGVAEAPDSEPASAPAVPSAQPAESPPPAGAPAAAPSPPPETNANSDS